MPSCFKSRTRRRSTLKYSIRIAVFSLIVFLALPVYAKKVIRITNVQQPTPAEMQRRIASLEAQVVQLNLLSQKSSSSQTKTQVQIISGNPASNTNGGSSSTVNYSNVTGAAKPEDNATVGATVGTNLLTSSSVLLQDPDILTSSLLSLKIDNNGQHKVDISTLYYSFTIDMLNNGVNGLDTGSLAGPQWYYLYVVFDGSNYAGIASAGLAPLIPTGYTYAKLVGLLYSRGSGLPLYPFQQRGTDWFLTTGGWQISAPTTSATFVAFDAALPPYISSVVKLQMGVDSYASGSLGVAVSVNGTDQYAQSVMVSDASFVGPFEVFEMPIEASGNGYFRKVGSGSGNAAVWIVGFKLNI